MNNKEKLINHLKRKIEHKEANISVLFSAFNYEPIISYEIDQVFSSASIIKVPIMLAVLEEVNSNKLSLNDYIYVKKEDILEDTECFKEAKKYCLYDLVEKMITKSDNTATNILIDLLTKERINEYIKVELKLKKTVLNRKMLDFDSLKKGIDNLTTQKDMYEIFRKIFSNEILNDKLIELAKEILLKQESKDQLNKHFNKKARFYHKTGELDYLNHDVGVLEIAENFYYLGIFLSETKEIEGDKKFASELGKDIGEYLSIK
ncbi:MAG: serine hydrolase [Erysipelotrichia bacterium]|nr:serine hydrolase [Erysipelotrichia bacterium]